MGEGIANLQNVLRAVCERVTQLQEGVQREDRGLRELQQWAATQNNGVARRLQFLYQQFAQFGPQMDMLGQGYREMQLVYQAGLDELNTQRRQREVELRNEVLQIMHNYQRQMEGSMTDSVFSTGTGAVGFAFPRSVGGERSKFATAGAGVEKD